MNHSGKISVISALFLIILASAAGAQSLEKRAAEIFEKGCLAPIVLALGNNSGVGDGAGVAQAVGSVFLAYDNRGMSQGLVGTPKYTVNAGRTTGTFSCYVASKDLTSRQLLRYFDTLSRVAANGAPLSKIEPARIDDAPEVPVEGKRRVFTSDGRQLLFEAIFYQSERGPVGAYYLTLEHRVKEQ